MTADDLDDAKYWMRRALAAESALVAARQEARREALEEAATIAQRGVTVVVAHWRCFICEKTHASFPEAAGCCSLIKRGEVRISLGWISAQGIEGHAPLPSISPGSGGEQT